VADTIFSATHSGGVPHSIPLTRNVHLLKWVDKIAELTRPDWIHWVDGSEQGWTPAYEDVAWTGLDFSKERFDELQAVNRDAWRAEVIGHEELFIDLHDRLPPEMMIYERELLICRL